MRTPKLTPDQLRWMTKVVIPVAIACGFVALALGTREVMLSPVTWISAAALLLTELLVVGAICQLTYRLVRLRRLGDVEA